jgi:transposase InsO family protein
MRHVDALSRAPYVGLVTRELHERIKNAQEQDGGLMAIREIMRERPYLDYVMENDVLYKGSKLVVPSGMESEIIKKVHEKGHFAKKKMTEMIDEDYHIKDLSRKIDEFMVTCIPCLLATKKSGKQEGLLHCIDKGSVPLDTLHCDHVGPLTETKKQYNYILTVVDAFTKFVWVYPTKGTTAKETLAKLSLHQQTFGNPARIITDRGAAFTSHDFKEYCETENIQHVLVTTGVPRGNGQAECTNRILISVLTKLCISEPGLWYRHVARVQTALNSTYQRSIDTTPFELLLGTKMRTKDDVQLYELLKQESYDSYVEEREQRRKSAQQQIMKIQQENRLTYNKKRKESRVYQIGERVAILRTQFGTCLKLKPKYFGPYRVVATTGKDRYDVEKVDSSSEGPARTTASADHMKPWPVTCA